MEKSKNPLIIPDKLTDLPDNLLHRVLPQFRAKEAVKTCVWSKKWKNFWVSLPYLNLDTREFRTDTKFVNFVDNLLERRDNRASLESFQLWCEDWVEQCNQSIINWILYAINLNPKVLRIEAFDCSFLPRPIFTCESLEELFLGIISSWKQIKEILPDAINLPKLKKLHLKGRICKNYEDWGEEYSDCVIINKILSFTPSLEELHLESLPLTESICSETLKKLKIEYCHGWWGLWELNTPKLESIYCTGNIVTLGDAICERKMLELRNVNVSIEDDGACGNVDSRVSSMLRNFSEVETLELCLKLGSCSYNKRRGVKGSLWGVALSRCYKLEIIEIKYSTFNDIVRRDVDALREAIKKHEKVELVLSQVDV